jgi:outer membrane protein OmpA-like peptidoglycan-associated protein
VWSAGTELLIDGYSSARDASPGNGIYLRVGDHLVGKPMAEMDTPAGAISRRDGWSAVSQSGGSAAGPGTITSTLSWTQPGTGRVYGVGVTLHYAGAGSDVHETFTVHVPEGNTDVVKLYQVMRSASSMGFGQQSPRRAGTISDEGTVVGIRGSAATRQTGTYVGSQVYQWPTTGRDFPADVADTPYGGNYEPHMHATDRPATTGIDWDVSALQGGSAGSVPAAGVQTVEQDLQLGRDPSLLAAREESITVEPVSTTPLTRRMLRLKLSTRSGRTPRVELDYWDGSCGNVRGTTVTLLAAGSCNLVAWLPNDSGHKKARAHVSFRISDPTSRAAIPVPRKPATTGPLQYTVALGHSRRGWDAPWGTPTSAFGWGSARLTDAGHSWIQSQAISLRAARTIECEGYADFAEPAAQQRALSLARARAVCAALWTNGVNATMTSVGYGGTWPAVVGGGDPAMRPVVGGRAAVRPENRRVVVVVVNG